MTVRHTLHRLLAAVAFLFVAPAHAGADGPNLVANGSFEEEGGPGATPTVEENRVFTISKWGDVFCFDATSGRIMWQRDLPRDGVKPNRWGLAGAPLV